MAVPISPEEQSSPLYKYFELSIEPTPEDIVDRIHKGNFAPSAALPPSQLNDLLKEGYLDGEFGWWTFPDGGAMIANLVQMPGVTPEMFDWWFAWHGLSPLRYKIWDPEDHYYCQTRNIRQALDQTLSLKERYWHTTHDLQEAFLPGDAPKELSPTFVPPEEIGFDPIKLQDFNGTIICSPGPTIMCHFVRPTEDGCELRTRFWMGYAIKDRKPVRVSDSPVPVQVPQSVLMHNVKEFRHLAKILPELYATYKDDFTVPPIRME